MANILADSIFKAGSIAPVQSTEKTCTTLAAGNTHTIAIPNYSEDITKSGNSTIFQHQAGKIINTYYLDDDKNRIRTTIGSVKISGNYKFTAKVNNTSHDTAYLALRLRMGATEVSVFDSVIGKFSTGDTWTGSFAKTLLLDDKLAGINSDYCNGILYLHVYADRENGVYYGDWLKKFKLDVTNLKLSFDIKTTKFSIVYEPYTYSEIALI